MFRSIAAKIPRDKDYPDRAFSIDVFTRVIEGALYDHLPNAFHQERTESNEYVKLRDRRPSVRYNICRMVVDDSVSLLFSEGHFPIPENEDIAVKESLRDFVKATNLNEVMLDAATKGAVGSVAIQLQVLKGSDGKYRPFVKAFRTTYLTPEFDKQRPDKLIGLTEKYKVKGKDLKAIGYTIDDDDLNSDFWFMRKWDLNEEIWFVPWLVKAKDGSANTAPPVRDEPRTVRHDLEFVPWIWVRNLPGELRLVATDAKEALSFSDDDGACTFAGAIDDMIEIDYQLSQAGRGLKYAMDPTLMLKEPAAPGGGEFIKSPDNALVVSKDGDAKLLEIDGGGFTVVLDFVRALREFALESVHGNRANADKISAAQSGRAMELLNQALIWLADRLRVSYGEGAILSLLRMAIAAHAKFPMTVGDKEWPKMATSTPVTLRWPRWYQPTASDRQNDSTTLKNHKEAGHISRETAVKAIAADFDIEDIQAELARIAKDVEDEAQRLLATKVSESIQVK
jgi:hypothetical protein